MDKATIEKIIAVFTDRKGFDAIWDECDEDIRDDIRNALSAIEQREGWVSVEERLPERNHAVLVAFNSGDIAVARFGGKRWIDPYNRDEDFTPPAYWQPLPEPPAAPGKG